MFLHQFAGAFGTFFPKLKRCPMVLFWKQLLKMEMWRYLRLLYSCGCLKGKKYKISRLTIWPQIWRFLAPRNPHCKTPLFAAFVSVSQASSARPSAPPLLPSQFARSLIVCLSDGRTSRTISDFVAQHSRFSAGRRSNNKCLFSTNRCS